MNCGAGAGLRGDLWQPNLMEQGWGSNLGPGVWAAQRALGSAAKRCSSVLVMSSLIFP